DLGLVIRSWRTSGPLHSILVLDDECMQGMHGAPAGSESVGVCAVEEERAQAIVENDAAFIPHHARTEIVVYAMNNGDGITPAIDHAHRRRIAAGMRCQCAKCR